MAKVLFIQTSFLGDVILCTALIEKWHQFHPDDSLDVLIRKGNETVFQDNPKISTCITWDKKNDKYKNLLSVLFEIRSMKYDVVINLQRFSSTGFLTAFSGAPIKIGFNKNPFSFMFTRVIEHKISTQSLIHETERNQKLIEGYTDKHAARPKIYTTELNRAKIESLVTSPYIVIAPASVWFTKQFPIHKWISFLSQLNTDAHIVFIGSADDRRFCARLIAEAGLKNQKLNFKNLCGELSIQDSAELMKNAILNFVNDSAPMHIASSVNAKTAAIFCSTVPEFGFGPLSDHHHIIQIHQQLSCRPCGLHGLKSCPEKHFNCANGISDQQLLELL